MMDLRELGADDWRRWRQARLSALADAPEAFRSTFEEWEHASEAQWRKRLEDVPLNIVAFDGDNIAGMVSAAQIEGDYQLISMWVAPHARGKGLGDDLVRAVTAYARARGARQVLLDVVQSNYAARRLYERQGFRYDGIIDDGSACSGELRMALAF